MAFAGTAFDLAVVARCIGANEFVPNAKLGGCSLEQRRFFF